MKYEWVRTGLSRLELSILRVNQILYKEASETLYEENPLVCVTIEPSLLEHIRDVSVNWRLGFPGDKPVSMSSYGRAVPVAVANMNLQRLPHNGCGIDGRPLLVSLFAMPRLCRILTDYKSIGEVEICVRLTVLEAGNVKRAWHESLLNCFEEARGFGNVRIFDAQGDNSHVELETLMKSPFKSLWDLVDRASTYYDRALRKQNLGRLFEALCDYKDGHDFITWFLSSKSCPTKRLEDEENNKKARLECSTKIGFSCAFLCIKFGDLGLALKLITWTMDKYFQNEDALVETQAWFLYGLRDLAVDAGNGAIYCFLQTLWKQPGHTGADEAIDEMETRLRSYSDTNWKNSTILHNIENVLQPFRHQAPGSAVMSKDGYELLLQQWKAGKRNYGSVGFLHWNGGSVSLDYRSRRKYQV